MVISMKAKNAGKDLVVYLKKPWNTDRVKGYQVGSRLVMRNLYRTAFSDSKGHLFFYDQVVIDPKKLSKYQ